MRQVIHDGVDELANQGLTRVIGFEIKVRIDYSMQYEVGMWVPDRELLIPSPRFNPHRRLEFPCTIHTLHGDLNYQVADVR